MKCSDSAEPIDRTGEALIEFQCNICGRQNRAASGRFQREVESCTGCGSTVRTRAVVQMIAREIFGLDITLPEFPVLKGVRGIGISDSPDYAERLAEKFSYRNTFYHKEPVFDILNVPETEWGSYDFLIASEVFEHVTPPVERAFSSALRLLKPNGLFFLTVPYTLEAISLEHFPELHDYGIARLSDRHVLVNRTREGRIEVFEDLVFHGGGGETLEIRRFNERELLAQFEKAGFRGVEIYGRNYPLYGILRTENWSLPMTARKEPFALGRSSVTGLVELCVRNTERLSSEAEHLRASVAEYHKWMEWAKGKMADDELEIGARTQWARNLEEQLKERTDWALHMKDDLAHHVELATRFQQETNDQALVAAQLQARVNDLERQLHELKASRWVKAGRLSRIVKG